MPISTQIEELLTSAIGLDVESIGVSSVARALRERKTALGLAEDTDYLNLLRASDREREELIERIVVPETWFFRDEKPFRMLQKYVIEEWLPSWPQAPLRLMSLPCSTGEEPYSMAMALFDIGLLPEQMSISAYDVSRSALAKARQAVYGKNSFRSDELSFRDRYFQATPSGYELDGAVRHAVVFAHGNILDAAFILAKGLFDIVFFRNLMIYLGREHQERALAAIDRLLAPSGLLFIGHAEGNPLLDRWFSSVRYPFAFAYRKHSDDRRKTPSPALTGPAPRMERRKPAALRAVTPNTVNAVELSRHTGKTSPKLNSTTLPATGPRAQQAKPVPPPAPPDHADLLEEARKLADQGKLDEARRCCETVLKEQGSKAGAYYLLGLIHDAGSHPDEAEQCFHKAVYLEPDHYQSLTHLALAAERRGDLQAARLFRHRAQRSEQRLKEATP